MVNYHFTQMDKMVDIGSNFKRNYARRFTNTEKSIKEIEKEKQKMFT